MKKEKICYTCKSCKINRRGHVYCSLRKQGGQCINYDKWESQEDVLDMIRAEVVGLERFETRGEKTPLINGDSVLQILDKYKAM